MNCLGMLFLVMSISRRFYPAAQLGRVSGHPPATSSS